MLPYGGLLLFSGKYGAYKSLWAFFMAAGIEAGTSVFRHKVLRKIPVLYVDHENHQQTVGERRTGIGLPDNAVRYWGDWIDDQADSESEWMNSGDWRNSPLRKKASSSLIP